jgi:hypothetical protein
MYNAQNAQDSNPQGGGADFGGGQQQSQSNTGGDNVTDVDFEEVK